VKRALVFTLALVLLSAGALWASGTWLYPSWSTGLTTGDLVVATGLPASMPGNFLTNITAPNYGSVMIGQGLKVIPIWATQQATAPTCTTNCGTSPSVSGNDHAGIVTMGSTGSPSSPFTVTFNGTYSAAPACIAMRRSGTAANVVQVVSTTGTTMVVTVATGIATSDTFNYVCEAVQ
jgi:hypothetical protein